MKEKKNSRLKLIALIAILFYTGMLQAQQNENPEGSVTPNAANSQNVNIDLFRGKQNISIPIYTFKSKHLSVPISLNYSPVDIIAARKRYVGTVSNIYGLLSYQEPSSITLDATSLTECHPGWTGLGWTLTAGGAITRSVNGIPDESLANTSTGEPAGNFSNYDPLYNPDNAVAKTNPTDPDVMYNTLYESGEDEFSFNFCGYSGTFLFYRGEWKIFSDVNFKIYPSIVSGVLKQIILETPDGITYTFGGFNNGSDNEAVEYSQYNTQPKIATSWFLTQIESPEGDQINFYYEKRDEFKYMYPITKTSTIYSAAKVLVNGSWQFTSFSTVTTPPAINDSYSIEPVYLARISSTSNPVVVNFYKSPSNAISYPTSYGTDYKLDNITLSSDSHDFKKIDFAYIENSAEALKLQSLQESGIATGGTATTLPAYQFGYTPNNNTEAPAVLNSISYPTGGSSSFEFEKQTYSLQQQPDLASSATVNEMNITSNEIKEHFYDPGFVTQSDGFRIKKQVSKGFSTDKALITNYYYTDNFPELDPAKAANNGTTGIKNREVRSGVNDEKYLYGYTYRMQKLTEYDCTIPAQLPNPTISSIQVGYSSVWVIQSKEGESGTISSMGATNYKFVNFITFKLNANGNLDSPADIINNNINQAGKMTSCVKYDAQKHETSTTNYEYENGPETIMTRYYQYSFIYNEYPGTTKRSHNTWRSYDTRYSQYKLAKKTDIVNTFYTTTTYKYNYATNNLTEVNVMEPTLNYNSISANATAGDVSDANYNTTTTSYKYSGDFYDEKYSGHNNTSNMDYHYWHYVKNAPVEKVVKKNGKIIAAQFTKYTYQEIPANSMSKARWALKSSEVYALEIQGPIDSTTYTHPTFNWDKGDSRYQLRTTFDQYDTYGNLLQYHNEGGAYMATYYDAAIQQPLINVKNITYNALNTQITGSNLSTPIDFLKLRKLLPNTQISSYTYDPKFGVTSVTAPNGVTTTKEYDAFGRLKCIKDTNGKILETMDYSFQIQ